MEVAMRHLALLSIFGLLGLAACAEMGLVPESEMRRNNDTYVYHGGRGY
jgi:hypothetical protein